jgi:hypothetical protein
MFAEAFERRSRVCTIKPAAANPSAESGQRLRLDCAASPGAPRHVPQELRFDADRERCG